VLLIKNTIMSDYYTQNLFFYKESIERLEQAIFFCYDEFNNKLPVGLIKSFVF